MPNFDWMATFSTHFYWPIFFSHSQKKFQIEQFTKFFQNKKKTKNFKFQVCLLIYVMLYALALFTIKYLRRSKESDEYVLDYEDAIADRVSILLCTFTLATCFGAVLLLPMSIIANEVIIITPQSFYWKWLNTSLLHYLWNTIFLFSNMSLFMFIPFAHLFVESIGLPGYRKGIKSRVIETSILLCLIAICMLGISYVISAVFDSDNAKSKSFLSGLFY